MHKTIFLIAAYFAKYIALKRKPKANTYFATYINPISLTLCSVQSEVTNFDIFPNKSF